MWKKLGIALITVFICTLLTFFIVRLNPVNPVEILANQYIREGLPRDMAYSRAKAVLNYDPDIPIFQSFFLYLGNLLRGNMGESMYYREPVLKIIGSALPWTLFVMVMALGCSAGLGVFLGMKVACTKHKKAAAAATNVYNSAIGSIPDYLIAYILILLLAVQLNLFPMMGAYSSELTPGFNFNFIMSCLYHAVLPILTYFVVQVSNWILAMRASAVSVLGSDFITYATARGIPHNQITKRYVGRNAIMPIITNILISFVFMFNGVAIIEVVFAYPGMGFYFSSAVGGLDYPLMQGLFLMISLTLVVLSFLADIIYGLLDPRLRKIMSKRFKKNKEVKKDGEPKTTKTAEAAETD